MVLKILSARARVSQKQSKNLLKCYSQRLSPKETAAFCKLSLNTVYLQYDRIRWRLVLSRYYQNGAFSFDEEGLAPNVKQQLKLRRGIGEEDIYPHVAELIDWSEEWSPRLVLKHLNKIIALTGPLDIQPELTEAEIAQLYAYVGHARVELVYERCKSNAPKDGTQNDFLRRIETTLDDTMRGYKTASKRAQRTRR